MKADDNQSNTAKKRRDRVPPPQKLRILQKYAAGQSVLQISREEHRDRQTVARVVKSEEMQQFIQQMREEFFGLAGDAIAAVRYTLQHEKDGKLGLQLLECMGVVPSNEEKLGIRFTESSSKDTEQAAVARETEKLAFITLNMARTFDQPLPHVVAQTHIHDQPQPDGGTDHSLSEGSESDLKNDQ